MIKQFRYLLCALLCAALLLAPVWAIGEEDDEESLRWLLSRQTDQESFDYFFYGDYDGDGVHEVGTVFVSLATADGTFVRELHVGDRRTRSYIRRVSGNFVFDMMRRYMMGLEIEQ